MRSLAPSMTLTWTLIVSPGWKAGRSSRSDVLSTKSSVFMSEDTSLRSRLRAAADRCERVGRQLSHGFGLWVRLAVGGSGPFGRQPLETTGQLCQIGPTQ